MVGQVVLTLAGLWLMVAPAVLGYDDAAATSDRIVGPVLAATAFLAIFRITRGLRWTNVVTGLWLVAGPWFLDVPTDARVSSVVVGVLALLLAWTGSPDQSRYGGGWRALWQTDRLARV